jgi:hypothetical protein
LALTCEFPEKKKKKFFFNLASSRFSAQAPQEEKIEPPVRKRVKITIGASAATPKTAEGE